MPLHYGTDGSAGASPGMSASYTVEEAIETLGFGCLQFKIYIICKLIVATDAIEIMLLSLAGPAIQCDWHLKESQVALISTAVFLGMAVSSPLMGILADRYGRRTSLLFATLWTAYFGLLTSFSPSYGWVLVMRGLVGVGMGGIPQSYALIAEFIPSRFRAKMIVLGELLWAGGALFEVVLAALVVPTLGWRWLVGLSAIPVVLAILGCLINPESARYLVAAGKTDEAQSILHRMSASNKRALPPGTLVASKKTPLASGRDLFRGEYLRSTLLLWPIWFIVSLAYYGIVLASPYLLTSDRTVDDDNATMSDDCFDCHVLSTEDYISLATSTVGEIVGLFFSFFLIDRIGRLWTWRLLMVAAAAFLFLLQIRTGVVLTTFFIFGVRGATLTAFNLCFIYTVELYPTNMRALGLGVCTAFGRTASMVTPFFAQMLMVYSVPLTVSIYGVACVIATLLMFLLPVETLGRPMLQNASFTVSEGEDSEATLVLSDNEAALVVSDNTE